MVDPGRGDASPDDRGATTPAVGGRGGPHLGFPWGGVALGVVVAVLAWKLSDIGARYLWFDEAFSWRLTRFPWAEMIARDARDVHPPLYYLVLKPWTLALGDSAVALRGLSVAWFVVALIAADRLAREAGDRDAGPIAVLLLSSGAFLLRYVQEARMYTQLLALLLVSSWALLRALRGGRRATAWWAAFALSAAAMAYTHYLGLFSLVAQGVFVAGLLTARSRFRPSELWRDPDARRAAAAGLAVVLLYLPWVPILLRQQSQVSENYWAPSVEASPPLSPEFWRVMALRCFLHHRAQLPPDYPEDDTLYVYLGYILLATSIAILAGLASRRDRLAWLLVVGVLLPIDISIVNSYRIGRNLIENRYLIGPFAMLLIGLAALLARIRSRAERWLVVCPIAANLFMGAYAYQEALDLPVHPELRGIADEIAAQRRPGDFVLSAETLDYFGLMFHARDRFAVRQLRGTGPGVEHFMGGPIFVPEDFVDEESLLGAENRRIWVVARSMSRRPWSQRGWHLVREMSYPEAIRWRGPILLQLWGREPDDPAARPQRPVAQAPIPGLGERRSTEDFSAGSSSGPRRADGPQPRLDPEHQAADTREARREVSGGAGEDAP